MKTKKLVAACSVILFSPIIHAGSVNTLEGAPDILLSGGVAAGYYYSTHTRSGDDKNFETTDVLVEISSQPIEIEPIDFTFGVGSLSGTTVTSAAGSDTQAEFGVQHASVKYAAFENLLLETGVLESHIGYESNVSFNNQHATLGALKTIQPGYNNAGRATYKMGDVNLYGEVSQPLAFALGMNGKISDWNFEMNYYDEDDGKSIIDLVLAGEVGKLKYALNVNYVLLDVKIADNDDTALAGALHFSADIARLTIPFRVEYIDDGTSGIYALTPGAKGYGKGFTLTTSPTLNISKAGYVRAEFSMVTTNNTILRDADGVGQKSAVSAAVQMGYRF